MAPKEIEKLSRSNQDRGEKSGIKSPRKIKDLRVTKEMVHLHLRTKGESVKNCKEESALAE